MQSKNKYVQWILGKCDFYAFHVGNSCVVLCNMPNNVVIPSVHNFAGEPYDMDTGISKCMEAIEGYLETIVLKTTGNTGRIQQPVIHFLQTPPLPTKFSANNEPFDSDPQIDEILRDVASKYGKYFNPDLN